MNKKLKTFQISALLLISLVVLVVIAPRGCPKRNKDKTGNSNKWPGINAPTNLVATVVSSTEIRLTWEDNSNNEDGFAIERKEWSNGTWSEIYRTIPNTTSYSDTDVDPFVIYYYRVRAFNTSGDYSDYSNEISFTVSIRWLTVSSNGFHTLGISDENTIWSWGRNNYYQLGMGDTQNRWTPTQIGLETDWDKITTGEEYSLGLKTNRTLWSWGGNLYGQLGLGDTLDTSAPFQVGMDSDWSDISAKNYQSFAIKTNGTIWACGFNRFWAGVFVPGGQLGLGDSIDRNTLTQIGSDSDWSTITGGYYHTLAIKNTNTLWVWGRNQFGQLGLGDSDYGTRRYTPTQIGTLSDWYRVAAGNGHTIASKTSGILWAWGDNEFGQLGLGDSGEETERCTPTQIGTFSDWSRITAGDTHTLALKTNGTIWAWGSNGWGQLGLGDNGMGTNMDIPTQVTSETDWSTIVGGNKRSFGLKTNRILWSWGGNSIGQLGLGDTTSRNAPCLFGSPMPPSGLITEIISSSQINLTWTDLSDNETGFIIQRKDGSSGNWQQIYTVGANITSYADTGLAQGIMYYYRIIAFNSIGNSSYSDTELITPTLFAPTGLSAIIVSSTQVNLSWTDNSPDELGFKIERGFNNPDAYVQIGTVPTPTTLYSDATVTPNNTYYYRVRAYNDGGNSDYTAPKSITPVLLAPSNLYSTVISSTGVNLYWTDNSPDETRFEIERSVSTNTAYSVLATVGADINSYPDASVSPNITYYYRVRGYTPLAYSLYSNEVSVTPVLFAPSNLYSTVISSTGVNLYWTDNSPDETRFEIERSVSTNTAYSVLATVGADINSYPDTSVSPNITYYYRVRGYNPLTYSLYSNEAVVIAGYWTKIAAGYNHTLGIKTNGTIWSWGRNNAGQLGLGDSGGPAFNRKTPTQIGDNSDWAAVTAGGAYNIARKTNGILWSWGGNDSGQLGLGHSININTPSQINNDTDWSIIAAGDAHTVSIKNNGRIWSWGDNSCGQLGFEVTDVRNTPTQMGNETNWSRITAGSYHTAAIKNNGTIWSWGYNLYGQLGLGDSGDGTERYTPTQIGAFSDWYWVAAGDGHTIASKTGGTLWAWGRNDESQLGLEIDLEHRNTPTQVGTDSDWSIVSAGSLQSFAIKTNATGRTLWSWGNNDSGVLGLGDIGLPFGVSPAQLGANSEIPDGPAGWMAVFSGNTHTIGIKNTGTIWTWGNNDRGQLGLGDIISRNTPTLVGE